MAELSFANMFVPLYTDHGAWRISALRGNSRKCLVFDLGNTLRGGIIGDGELVGCPNRALGEHCKMGRSLLVGLYQDGSLCTCGRR
jgi:predicted enzyme involved in methoxymalonyl-ACP biosynthesis